MLNKVLSVSHVLLAFVALGFICYAFYLAVTAPVFGVLECVIVAAFAAVNASICRDLSNK